MSLERAIAIRSALVGDLSDDAKVVLTPIPAMFSRFEFHGWGPVDSAGWWPRLEYAGVNVVLTPQGSAIIDLSLGLRKNPRVEILGYAGSHDTAIDVGEIVRPAFARKAGQAAAAPMDSDSHTTVTTVTHLLASYQSGSILPMSVTDMECAHVAFALREVGGVDPGARLLITDRWPDSPFYVHDTERTKLIASQRRHLVDELVDELVS